MTAIPNQKHRDVFDILFGSGCRITEIIGETKKRCITCRHMGLIDKTKGPGQPYCKLTAQLLPKSPRLHFCERQEQKHPGLMVEQIDFQAGTIRLVGKGEVDRVIAMNTTALQALKGFIGNQTSGAINFGIGVRRIEQLARSYATKANLPDLAKFGRWSPHKMRHSFLTWFVEAARDMGEKDAVSLAQEQAGHSSQATTEIYLHTGSEARKRIADKGTVINI